MGLSNDLLTQFAKATNAGKKTDTETTVYGTIVEYEGEKRVRLDGSDQLIPTPATMTASAEPGERVAIKIKNHSAIVTGNISSPSAPVSKVEEIDGKTSVFIPRLEATEAEIGTLKADNAEIKNLVAAKADIEELNAINATIENLDAKYITADKVEAEYVKADTLDAKYATIEKLEAEYAKVDTLDAKYATVEKLEAEYAKVDTLDAKYANIDFTNIGKAAMEYFYAQSGLIENVIVGDQTITGNLVGVTISGDLIEGNTIVAEKLVIKGSDGLYYKLNTDGMKTEAQQTDYNSINGTVIKAKSITATKISVSDLVAFDATIGGFHITDGSLYSGVKESVNNQTNGIYLDSTGQMNVGGGSQYLKYYKDTDGTYKLVISASSIILGTSGTNVETALGNVQTDISNVQTDVGNVQTEVDGTQETASDLQTRVERAEAGIQQIENAIMMLVTDDSGTSYMTQTGDGWTFNISSIQGVVDNTSRSLSELLEEFGSVDAVVAELQKRVNELGGIAEYVRVGTYEYVDDEGELQTEPCIELGETDSEFKQRITNTRAMYLDGTVMKTYVSKDGLITETLEVKSGEFKISGLVEVTDDGGDTYVSKINYIWKVRANGNCGMIIDGWLG